MKANGPIGVFDSGIGGVTVLKELKKILPDEDYVYYSDSKNSPYGDKSKQEVIKLSKSVIDILLEKQCKAIVIACNTASAIAAKTLREEYPEIPIVAIEPAYKMVHDFAYEKPTLVMATKGTIESEKFNLLYDTYNNHKTYLLPCIGLADAIEKGDFSEIKQILKEKLKPYQGKVENVVLGCTHYPLVKNEITEVLGKVTFFDGAPRMALHMKEMLKQKKWLSQKNTGEMIFMDSQKNDLAKQKEKRFREIMQVLDKNE